MLDILVAQVGKGARIVAVVGQGSRGATICARCLPTSGHGRRFSSTPTISVLADIRANFRFRGYGPVADIQPLSDLRLQEEVCIGFDHRIHRYMQRVYPLATLFDVFVRGMLPLQVW